MIDPGAGLAILGSAIGSKDLVQKILGPTADYLGKGLAGLAERSVENTGRVFLKAKNRLRERIDQPGAVPPKVLKGILENAPFCEDELGAEYFGGVLASSRTEVGRDDRGAAFIALIGRLSTYEIRAHFIFYSAVHSLYHGFVTNIAAPEGRGQLETFIPLKDFGSLMELGTNENVQNVLAHVMFGLAREALIDNDFVYGTLAEMKQHYQRATTEGIAFAPSPLGTDLFLWAHGRGDLNINSLLDKHVTLTSDVKLHLTPGIRSTKFGNIIFSRNAPNEEAAKNPQCGTHCETDVPEQ
jgi:hypothetical protein